MSSAATEAIIVGASPNIVTDGSEDSQSEIVKKTPSLSPSEYTKEAALLLLGTKKLVPCEIIEPGVTAFSTGNFQFLVHNGYRIPYVQCLFCQKLLKYKCSAGGVRGLTSHIDICKGHKKGQQTNGKLPSLIDLNFIGLRCNIVIPSHESNNMFSWCPPTAANPIFTFQCLWKKKCSFFPYCLS